MRRSRGLPALLLAFAAAGPAAAKDALPPWLQEAARLSTPAGKTTRGAVVLLREREVTVREDGRLTIVERAALRITDATGRSDAAARVVYETESDKVKDLMAWVQPPSGEPRRLGKDRVVDVAAATNDVFNEARVRGITASDEVVAGSLFGYEWVLESRPLFAQFDWDFQHTLAVGVARCRVVLPKGWTATGLVFNHDPVPPASSGGALVWEVKDLPEIPDEPLCPPASALAPRLAVSYRPAAGAAEYGRDFGSWGDVARWLSDLAEGAPRDAVAAKSRELTSGAATEKERVAALCRYVASLKYVSIQTGLGRGGGYRPHDPAEVLARGYGDCKDKSNLLRALLRAAGVKAWLVSLYSGDEGFVHPEWTTPQQFNHCIVAIASSEEGPAALPSSPLGRVLLFDPTADGVPLGELPAEDEGTWALLIAPESTSLLRVPATPDSGDLLERSIAAELEADGTVKATLRDRRTGPSAVRLRGSRRSDDEAGIRAGLEAWFAERAAGARVLSTKYDGGLEKKAASLEVSFEAPRRAQKLPGGLLVFASGLVSSWDLPTLPAADRVTPHTLRGRSYKETLTLKLPEGIVTDELPRPVSLDTPFGRFGLTAKVEGRTVVLTRTLELRKGTYARGEAAALRAFFGKVRAGLDAPIVLRAG